MLSREQLTSKIKIWELEGIKKIRGLTDSERVELARLYIYWRAIKLFKEKSSAIDRGEVLAWDYDCKVLKLVKDILLHTRDNWQLETDEKRRRSLNNIVRTTMLLSRSFTNLYNTAHTEEVNIWRNLQFLVQYQITMQDFGVNQVLPIDAANINGIFQELFSLIDSVLAKEIRFGLKLESILSNLQNSRDSMPIDMLNHLQWLKRDVRIPYGNTNKLPLLEAIANYGREKLRIGKMLRAIRLAKGLDVTTNHGKMALLRQLQIIGETATSKNLTSSTKRLAQDVDWQLLVQLRNKLSHNEWDTHSGLLDAHCTTERMKSIQIDDLVTLETSIQQLQVKHDEIGQSNERMKQHYDPAWHLRAATRQQFKDFLRDTYIAKVICKDCLIYLQNFLNSDIRGRNLAWEIKPDIERIFTNRHRDTSHLVPAFGALFNSCKNEIKYHKNLENPDVRTQALHSARLSTYQKNIRYFNGLLNYTDTSYKYDFQDHAFSFNPLRLIALVRKEILAIRHILDPLPGSKMLMGLFPEDVTTISSVDRIFSIIAASADQVTLEAIQHIRTYCDLIHKPLYLQLDGLHGVRRGEIAKYNFSLTSEDISRLIAPIRRFGMKCHFYISLLEQPDKEEACFYHMARIQKYVVVLKLKLSNPIISSQLPNYEEFKALRNFIHHGIDLFDTMNTNSIEFMARYASLFNNRLFPAISKIEHDILSNRQSLANSLLDYGFYRRASPGITRMEVNIQNRPRSLSL